MLVVDADPASTLAYALGIQHQGLTLAEIRDSDILSPRAISELKEGETAAGHLRSMISKSSVITPFL